MRNVKLTIEYDGTNFYGWQKQPNLRTVEEELENGLLSLTKENVKLFGSGRTDRGVHGKGQVANFKTSSNIPPDKFKYALNAILPEDISIKDSTEVYLDFHSRYSAVAKEYSYLIYNNSIRSPLLRNYSYHIPYTLDLKRMKYGTKFFLGTHDFYGFMSSGSSVKNTIRTIHDINLDKNGDIIEFKVKGNGFLYNMVRIMVGTLLDVGSKKIDPDKLPDIINSKDRILSGATAPAQGLYLEKVFY